MSDILTITSPTPATVIYAGQAFVVSGTVQPSPIVVRAGSKVVGTIIPSGGAWQYTHTGTAAGTFTITVSAGGAYASVQVTIVAHAPPPPADPFSPAFSPSFG